MLDGAELGQALAAYPGDCEAAFSAYESALFPRSQAAAADAHQTLALCLADAAPFSLAAFFAGANDAPPDGIPE